MQQRALSLDVSTSTFTFCPTTERNDFHIITMAKFVQSRQMLLFKIHAELLNKGQIGSYFYSMRNSMQNLTLLYIFYVTIAQVISNIFI